MTIPDPPSHATSFSRVGQNTPVSDLPRQWRAAHYYAAQQGWAVLPLAPGKKIPLISKSEGGRGSRSATRDLSRIVEWACRYPGAGIGIATGPASDLIVIDVDSHRDGDASLARLTREHGPLPATLEQSTPRGGHHLIYRWRHDLRDVVQRELAPGIDLRVGGGYIVAAPTSTAAGTYGWTCPPWRASIADCPDWLARILPRRRRCQHTTRDHRRPTGDIVERARRYIQRMPPAISGSGGHRATWSVALVLVRGFSLDPSEALRLMLTEYNPRCSPPWRTSDLVHKVESALAVGSAERGWLLRDGGPA